MVVLKGVKPWIWTVAPIRFAGILDVQVTREREESRKTPRFWTVQLEGWNWHLLKRRKGDRFRKDSELGFEQVNSEMLLRDVPN